MTDKKPDRMPPIVMGRRIARLRKSMHMSTRGMAAWINRSESALRQMEAGARPIPEPLEEWFLKLEQFVEQNTPPAKVR